MNFKDSQKSGFSFASIIALVASLLFFSAPSASATNDLVDQGDSNRIMTVANSSNSWTIAQNSSGADAMKFTTSALPITVTINVRSVWNTQAVNSSTFGCNLYNGSTWLTSSAGVSIATVGADSASISCALTFTSFHSGEFEIGSARTQGNYGRVRYIVEGISGGGSSAPDCQVNGSPATIAQLGSNRSTLAPGEFYQTTLGGQVISSPCGISLNGGYWVRLSVNSTVVTVSGGAQVTRVTFTNVAPVSYSQLVTDLANRGYSTPIQSGDVWKREYFTSTTSPVSGDIPVATVTMTLGVSGVSAPTPSVVVRPVYEGPRIITTLTPRPILSGGALVFKGEGLSAITSATIGTKDVSMSYSVANGLAIGTPAGLAPGKYDLVMQSSYGTLTHINAVTIKGPTPTQTIGFKGEGEYLNEAQVAQLVEFNSSLNADYEKVRCIVNAADVEVAKAIALRVCAHVARGEARNVEAIQDVRSTYKGSGFWVRVYAKG
jgi:hypothetical protein